jgi:hypothetical protein
MMAHVGEQGSLLREGRAKSPSNPTARARRRARVETLAGPA